MSEWKQTKLGDLLKIKHGYAFKSSDYVQESSFPLVTLKSISESSSFYFDESKATYYGGDIPAEYILNQGDLIIPLTEQVIGLLGNSAFVPKINKYTFLLNQRVGKIINDENKVDRVYLKYLMSTSNVRNQMEYRAHGTKQRNISPKDIYDITVIIPAIKTQKEIGLILKNIEDKITLNNKINQELEAMAKTLYDYWFVQFDFPDENGKPYKSSGGKMVYNDQLKREIPEGWGVKQLGEVCEFRNGINYEKSETGDTHSKIVNVRNISNSSTFVTTHDLDSIALDRRRIESYLVTDRTILITRSGIPGATRIVSDIPANTIYSGFIIGATVANLNLFYYVFYHLKNIEMHMSNQSAGTIMKNISQTTLSEICIAIPNKEIQKVFSNQVRSLLDVIENNLKQNQELTQLRDWLLPMLMNGQVKVEDKT